MYIISKKRALRSKKTEKMASPTVISSQCIVTTTEHKCVCGKTFPTLARLAQHASDAKCSGEKQRTKKQPNSNKKPAENRKSPGTWQKRAEKSSTTPPQAEEGLAEWCAENDDCRCMRWISKTQEVSVKFFKEEGRPIRTAKSFEKLFKLLKAAGQKTFVCSKCPEDLSIAERTTTNIIRHLKEHHPRNEEDDNVCCKICQEDGIETYVPRGEIGKHVATAHRNRKKTTCGVCKEEFPHDKIGGHMKTAHPDHRRCGQCTGINYIHKDNFSEHNAKCHAKNGKSGAVKCRGCSKHIARESLSKHNKTCKH